MKTLQEILREGEHKGQSFFENTDDVLEIARTLVAFSNCDGGVLLIGLKKNGKIVGVDPQNELLNISLILQENCEPHMTISSRIFQEKVRIVLEISVLSGNEKPYNVIYNSKKEVFIRKENRNILANKMVEDVWKFKRLNEVKPINLSPAEKTMLDLIHSNSKISLTKIHKKSNLSFSEIDRVLVRLISWNYIVMEMTDNGTEFSEYLKAPNHL